MRYATSDNFTGQPLPGYRANTCLLRQPVAEALAKVQADLDATAPGLALLAYDCYRPARAVAAMVRWGKAGGSKRGGSRFYPRLARGTLVGGGYISSQSHHSWGTAIDLTLVRVVPPRPRPAERPTPGTEKNAAGKSTGSPDRRLTQPADTATKVQGLPVVPANEDCSADARDPALADGALPVPMGTSFDCFDPLSHTDAAVSNEAHRNRMLLKSVMQRYGFRNYFREWWHFSFPAAEPGQSLDVEIR